MSILHDVITLTAGKVTSRDLGYKHNCLKTKTTKLITDGDFHNKKSNELMEKEV